MYSESLQVETKPLELGFYLRYSLNILIITNTFEFLFFAQTRDFLGVSITLAYPFLITFANVLLNFRRHPADPFAFA